MRICWSDTETYSDAPITHGSHRYAEQAEVLLWAYAFDDGPVKVWDLTTGAHMPADLAGALADEACLFCFHNSHFDCTVLHHCGYEIPLHRVHDTLVMALSHSLPGSLDKLGEVLGLPQDMQKHKEGKALIQLLCKPRPKNVKLRRATRETHPEAWARFVEYARQDVAAMREIYKKLPKWNYPNNPDEYALWQLDQRINRRGVTIDLDLAAAAIRAADRAQSDLAKRTHTLTDGEVTAATQRDKLLAHILEAHGIELPDMQASTLEKLLENGYHGASGELPGPVRELLLIRLQASKTSVSKYRRLIDVTSSDGRLRGLLQFNGASRTGRWAGRNFQPQNLSRPTMKQKQIDLGIDAMKHDAEDLLFDNVMELASSAIRGAIIAPEGKKLVVADLSNIEGRVLAWLAGEEWKLQAFRDYDAGTGHDLYVLAYAKSFGITAEEVMENKKSGDGSMRQIGKVMELAMGYAGGVGAFITFALVYGIDLEQMAEAAISAIPDGIQREAIRAWEWAGKEKRTFGLTQRAYVVCDSFKRLWREAHPNVVSLWRDVEDAVRNAVMNPGVTIPCRSLKIRRDGAWTCVVLPSGRALCYPAMAMDDTGQLSYMGINQYSRKWQRIKTYSGKLVENITQGAARDVLAHGMMGIEADGFAIVLTIHDEIIAEAPDVRWYSTERLAAHMATTPPWAPGLPLAAAGFESYRYKKD